MKKWIGITLLLASSTSFLFGQSSLIQVKTSGFEDENEIVSNGMPWGIVVDTGGIGFTEVGSSSLLPISAFPATSSFVDLDVQGAGAGLVFYRAGTNTTSSGPPSFNDGFMNEVSLPYSSGVLSGQSYGILWFSAASGIAGDSYGFVNPGQTLPAPASTVDISGSVSPGAANLTVVPEPSTFAFFAGLLGLGVVFCRRRRG